MFPNVCLTTVKKQAKSFFVLSVLVLSCVAFALEVIPGIPAKLFVVPTLGLMLFLSLTKLYEKIKLEEKIFFDISFFVAILSSIALIAEILPEVSAKLFVLPVLALSIIFSSSVFIRIKKW